MSHSLDIDRLCKLAALELSADDRTSLEADLQKVLDYVDTLKSVDVEGLEPTHHPAGSSTPLRPDERQPCLGADAALEQAPARHGDHFEVPPVMQEDS